jgi:MoaA/NifB/PqqE/SkfB family radical SAM enzyme
LHSRFPEMVRLAHEKGARTEMTSNAMLLPSSMAERLIDAGLDQFTVSIDGTSNESHGTVRPGASLEQITGNVRRLYSWSQKKCITQLDIEKPLKEEMLRHLKDSAGSIYGLLDMISYKVPIEGDPDQAPPAPVH